MTNTAKDITVIVPVHELNDVTENLFKNAVTSVYEQTEVPHLLIVATPNTYDKVVELTTNHDCEVIKNEGHSDFSSQVNYGVEHTKTTWFSVLEFDDEYANIWFKNVVKYQAAYPEVDLFLPIIIDVNEQNQFVGFSNEAVWANSFSDVLGVLDNNAVLTYQGFNIDGMVMKKETYLNNGGFKKNLKLTFLYEFLLRMTFKDVKTMVIPKFGYKHTNQRTGSLFHDLQSEMNPVEANWWLAQAKKEYYFDKDREITYQD
jgi:hypothetical protein